MTAHIPEEKKCRRCEEIKNKSFFQIRTEKRATRSSAPFQYLDSHCRRCRADIQKDRNGQVKNDPEHKILRKKWSRASYWKNREKNLAYGKQRRATEHAKDMRKEYDRTHKETISRQRVVVNSRYNKKIKDTKPLEYAVRLIQSKNKGLSKAEIRKHTDLLVATNLIIQIKRSIKNGNNNQC